LARIIAVNDDPAVSITPMTNELPRFEDRMLIGGF